MTITNLKDLLGKNSNPRLRFWHAFCDIFYETMVVIKRDESCPDYIKEDLVALETDAVLNIVTCLVDMILKTFTPDMELYPDAVNLLTKIKKLLLNG